MPIEGVSSQNSGFYQINPTEVNFQAEAVSKTEAEKRIKAPNKSDETKSDSEENEDQHRDFYGKYSDDEDPANDSQNFEQLLQDNKKFKVKFNSSTEMVEMIDIISGDVVEFWKTGCVNNYLSTLKGEA